MESSDAASGRVFHQTASHKGRHISVTPDNSTMRHLAYGRIILDETFPTVRFETRNREIGLLSLAGPCKIKVGDASYDIGQYDGIYIPPKSEVEVTSLGQRVDLCECSAEVEGTYDVQVIRYEDVKKDPALKFSTGGPSASRHLNIIFGRNIQAGRIMCGFTRSEPGNWTSWPPHEHSHMLEELYVFFDMPPPAYGVQFVYTNRDTPEFVGMVSDGDAVVVPKGYHPNVAIPGHSINFIWMMAAQREGDDRQFGVVNVEPDFGQAKSGLEASRK
jgi:5-deoxy-glucuronate isomerase